MRIGILTYHRSYNYGALLQAYALKVCLSSFGHDVVFVDYWPEYHKEVYLIWSWRKFNNNNIKGKIKMLLGLLQIKAWRQMQTVFHAFIGEYINPLGSIDEEYDLVIYGSDQIWRKQNHPSYKGFNDVYFGSSIIKTKKKITFSASMGRINLNEEDKLFLEKQLMNFDALSVRESDLLQVIKPLTTLDVFHTLDPIFLLNKDQWGQFASLPSPTLGEYILLYNLHSDPLVKKIALELSEKCNLSIISLKGAMEFKVKENKISATGPKEFLGLIKNAKYIVTSSFHGVAFSILFEKQFYVSMRRNTSRVSSLLSLFGLDERYVKDKTYDLKKIGVIDYENLSQSYNAARNESMSYLIKHIN